MSQENVEIIRRVTEAWNRADLDPILGYVDPDVEVVPVIPTLVDGEETVYRGVAGIRRFWKDWRLEWNFQLGESEFRDLGDTVLALTHISLTGHASGIELDQPMAVVYKLKDGRILWVNSYLDIREALEAVGLLE